MCYQFIFFEIKTSGDCVTAAERLWDDGKADSVCFCYSGAAGGAGWKQ